MTSTQENRGCLTRLMPKKLLPKPQPSPEVKEAPDKRPDLPLELAYRKANSVLTHAELNFYLVLRQIINPQKIIICPKVTLYDILKVKPREYRVRRFYSNKIKSKHIDFMLCDAETLKPLAAIELDDNSHNRPSRRERDKFLNAAFQAVGLPIIHIRVQYSYNPDEIRKAIQQEIKRAADPVPPPQVENVEAPRPPTCPSCHTPMVERVASRGPQAGQPFWGCENYPNCREIKPMR